MVKVNESVGIILLLIMLSLTSQSTTADESNPAVMTGQGFAEICSRADSDSIGFCHGFIQATHDVFSDSLCIPAEITRAQLVGTMHKFFIENEEVQELYAVSVIGALLSSMYPC